MTGKANWRDHRAALSEVPDPPTPRAVKLECGHHSAGSPVASSRAAAFYRCPNGCGLVKRKR